MSSAVTTADAPVATARRAVFSDAKETPPTRLELRGALPPYVEGTLWRNGPGVFALKHQQGETAVGHWFDAPSILHAFTVRDGGVVYCARETSTGLMKAAAAAKGVEEWAAVEGGRYRVGIRDPCRGIFGKAMALWRGSLSGLATKNVGVTVEEVPGRGLCSRSDMPIAFTIREERWTKGDGEEAVEEGDFFNWASVEVVGGEDGGHGDAKGGRSLRGEMSAAHGDYDPATGEYYNFVYSFGGLSGKVDYKVFCLSGEEGKANVVATIPYMPTYCHSLVITDNLEAAVTFDPAGHATFFVISRAAGGVVATYTAPPFFAFHFINARDTPAGDIEIDLCHYQDASVLSQLTVDNLREREGSFFAHALPWRYTLPAVAVQAGGGGAGTATARKLSPVSFELPRINPLFTRREYRYAYGPGPGVNSGESEAPLACIVKVDFESGERMQWCEGDMHCSEPIFVPNPDGQDEDDGVLLSICYSAAETRSFLVALSAKDMTEVARAYTPTVVPAGFHGLWR